MHPLTIVRELRAGITDEQRAEWLASDAVAWATSSSRSRGSPTYCVMVDDTCQYAAENVEFEEGEPEKWSWSTTAVWTGTHRSRGNGSPWQGFGWPACLVGRWAIRTPELPSCAGRTFAITRGAAS